MQGWLPPDSIAFGRFLGLEHSNLIGMIGFGVLALSLYHFARKPLE